MTYEEREKYREMVREQEAIEDVYRAIIDSKVVQMVSHAGRFYCLCDSGKMFVWTGEDPGIRGGVGDGWVVLESPSQEARRLLKFELEEWARKRKEAKDGQAPSE